MNICLCESKLFGHPGEVLMAGVGGGEASHEVDSVGVTASTYHIMLTLATCPAFILHPRPVAGDTSRVNTGGDSKEAVWILWQRSLLTKERGGGGE